MILQVDLRRVKEKENDYPEKSKNLLDRFRETTAELSLFSRQCRLKKTEKSQYILNLTRLVANKTRFWAWGKTNDIANTKKLHSVSLTNDLLNFITNNLYY
jgi:hypothetical protein